MTERTIDDGPWCWASKDALRKIVDGCGDRPDQASIMATYLALCWEASNQESGRVTAPKRKLGAMAGIQYRKAGDALQFLRKIGVIDIQANYLPDSKDQEANTYILLSAGHPPGTICTTPGTSCTTPCMDGEHDFFAHLIEEHKKNNTRSTSAPAEKVSKKGRSRTRDPIIDALASIECPDLSQVTPKAWMRFATARKEIVAVTPDVTPDEIARRLAAYRRAWPKDRHTAMSLASHWGEYPPTTHSRASNGPTFV